MASSSHQGRTDARAASRVRLALAVSLLASATTIAVGCEPPFVGGQPSPSSPPVVGRPSAGASPPDALVDEAFRPAGPTVPAMVVRVVDGDTIVVRIDGREKRLRYIGMDTPETVKPGSPVEWMGPEASRANAALVEGKTVELEKDVSETDQYGRLLRYVWLVDGNRWTMVGLELVRRGYAQVETDPPDVRYAGRFVAAQRAARDAGLGLWGPAPSGP